MFLLVVFLLLLNVYQFLYQQFYSDFVLPEGFIAIPNEKIAAQFATVALNSYLGEEYVKTKLEEPLVMEPGEIWEDGWWVSFSVKDSRYAYKVGLYEKDARIYKIVKYNRSFLS